MNILQLLAHSIEEHDQLRLWHAMGHDVFSIGGYIDPAHPHVDIRPALPDVPFHRELKAVVDALGQPHATVPLHEALMPTNVSVGRCADGHSDPMEAARRYLPDELLAWADVIVCHHLEHTWLIPQWSHIRDKRVIWRTVGQSAHMNEALMAPLHRDGLEIVRYSPKERNLPNYAGEDALIRFYKDPDEWTGWTGDTEAVLNVTQKLYRRSLADDGQLQRPGWQWTSYTFWDRATNDLPRTEGGPSDDAGTGQWTTEAMQDALRSHRAYLYTGTQPASYTLGFIEALMTGIPVVSIGPSWHRILPYGPLLFEGHELAPLAADDPGKAREWLLALLNDRAFAQDVSAEQRMKAIDLFGLDTIQSQWSDYLDGGQTAQADRTLVGVAA